MKNYAPLFRKRFFTFLVIFLISTVSYVYGATITVCASGCDHTTISAAITAASNGDTIQVSGGTYTIGTTIDVDKQVKILGPMADEDPRPVAGTSRTAGSGSEAIIDRGGGSAIFSIQESDVEINGFEITNASGDLISSPSGSGLSNVTISYNIIHMATGDEGIQLRDVDGALIEYNYLFDIAQDAINLCCSSQNGIIQFNEITTASSDNATIYIYDMGPGIQILDNLLYDNTVNDGIKFGQRNGPDAGVDAMGVIARNIVRNQTQDGISVYASNIQVMDNEITGSTSDNGAIFVQFLVNDISITGNELTMNATNAIKIGDDDGGPNLQTLLIENNCISGNDFGLLNLKTTIVNAENNWWGDPSGPTHTTNAGGTGDEVSDRVDFDPFLTESPCLDIIIPIPTMSQWGLIVLSLIMMVFGVVVFKYRRLQNYSLL